MLDSAAHFHQVPQDVLPTVLVGLDVDHAHGNEEVETGHNVARILHELVQIGHLYIFDLGFMYKCKLHDCINHLICINKNNQ